jgi:hypothetical protein
MLQAVAQSPLLQALNFHHLARSLALSRHIAVLLAAGR